MIPRDHLIPILLSHRSAQSAASDADPAGHRKRSTGHSSTTCFIRLPEINPTTTARFGDRPARTRELGLNNAGDTPPPEGGGFSFTLSFMKECRGTAALDGLYLETLS
jgi:hypothetical protein